MNNDVKTVSFCRFIFIELIWIFHDEKKMDQIICVYCVTIPNFFIEFWPVIGLCFPFPVFYIFFISLF